MPFLQAAEVFQTCFTSMITIDHRNYKGKGAPLDAPFKFIV
jgi:hypothetical protein